MIKKLFITALALTLALSMRPAASLAAGISASGGGTKTVGQSFTVTVTASGTTFNALEGLISVSGPVSITSFSAGNATWVTAPANGVRFKGMVVGGTSSLTVASIKLKATGVGSGSVSVGSVRLANNGAEVGSTGGSANFTIQKAADLPGVVKVSSTSHPDENTSYEETTIVLSWTKEGGVDGFSYLLDQSESTTPAAKIIDANTGVSYADKAVGTYWFHIRAHKADGWGQTTHFKINIKEPDAKIDPLLSQPNNIKIEKDAVFTNNIADGTVTGVVVSGQTEPGFTANIIMVPAPTLPESKTMSALADAAGYFKLIIDFPIASGYHKLTVQGQRDKVLTPVSDEIIFEISQRNGGSIAVLTEADEHSVIEATKTKYNTTPNRLIAYSIVLVVVLILLLVVIVRRRHRNFA